MHSALAAESEFYAAFAATDLARMRNVWAEGSPCVCIHPAGMPIEGYEAIMMSWAQILGSANPVELHCEPISHIEAPDTVISTVYEHFAPPGTDAALAPVIATNVYRLLGGAWKMVAHHASPVVSRPPLVPRTPAATRH